jgi:hypothetical protein
VLQESSSQRPKQPETATQYCRQCIAMLIQIYNALRPCKHGRAQCSICAMCWLYLTSNEGEALLLPFTSPALGWLYDKGDQLLYSILLLQECYQTSIQGLALLQMMTAALCKPAGCMCHRLDTHVPSATRPYLHQPLTRSRNDMLQSLMLVQMLLSEQLPDLEHVLVSDNIMYDP